ncbi:endoglucanase [Methanobrevibacter sp. TMH8]|uniref:endoglucanase n=1 Tax=Methanobrevibacter sp. TMH8 TaxID=2848611 RepID=UPI001CC9DFE2|nr:endoglucanase [Methanobrevibacter sp. TMH8]MBZ9570930.1 endoglucanase [Methanobrevibacter sp. TMH8]
MKNSNIIISVIIVLCIAGGVTAYSITNPEGSIFSLPGFTPSSDSGAGDLAGDNGVNNGTTSNSSGSTGGSSSGSSNGGSSSQSSGSSGSNVHIGMTSSQAQTIINNAVGEPGAYAGSAQWDSSINMWVAKIYDKDGNVVDAIGVDSNKRTNRV